MKKDDSDEEDSKPPARDNSAAGQQGKPTSKRKRSEDSKACSSHEKAPPGVQNVASLPAGKRLKNVTAPPVATYKVKKGSPKTTPSSASVTGIPFKNERTTARRPKLRIQAMEENVPENETPEERRLRRNRVNDRRKRARRAMKVDFLQEQYQSMKAQNEEIRAENQALREQISAIRRSRGLTGLNPETPAPGNAQPSCNASRDDAGAPTKPSEVLSTVVRSRLDESVLAVMNRQAPPSLAATTFNSQAPPITPPQGINHHGPPQGRPRRNSARGNDSLLSSPQEVVSSSITPSLPSLGLQPQGSAIASSTEQPEVNPAIIALLRTLMQSGLSSEGQPEPPLHRHPGDSLGGDPQRQGFTPLLSSLQQRQAAPPQQRRSSSHTLNSSEARMQIQRGTTTIDSELLLAALQQERDRGSNASGFTGGATDARSDQRLASLLHSLASASSENNVWRFLNNRDGQPAASHDQSASSIFRQVVGETKEELSGSEQVSLHGGHSIDTLTTMLQQSREGEAHLLALFQRQLNAQSLGMSPNAVSDTLQRQLHRRDDDPTGQRSLSQQPGGPQMTTLMALLQQRQSSLQLGGASFQQQLMENESISPQVIAALQQLQSGGRAAPDLAEILYRLRQGQASTSLRPAHNSNERREHEIDSLQLRSPAIDESQRRLQPQLRGALGHQPSLPSNLRQESPNETMPGGGGNAGDLLSSLLRHGRSSLIPGATQTNSALNQIEAIQGMFTEQTELSGTVSSTRTLASQLARAQSNLAANSINSVSPSFTRDATGVYDTSRLTLANLAQVYDVVNGSIGTPPTLFQQFQGLSGLYTTQAGHLLPREDQANLLLLQSLHQAQHQGQIFQPGAETTASIHSIMLQPGENNLLQLRADQQQTNPRIQEGTGVAPGRSSQAVPPRLQEAYSGIDRTNSISDARIDEKDNASGENDRHRA